MPQLTVISAAVSARHGERARRAQRYLEVGGAPEREQETPATGTDQTMRCATTSAAGMCATAFMKIGCTPHSR